jgi:uncharacterized protein (DUF362 family)
MDRRKFIKQGIGTGIMAGAGISSVYPAFSIHQNKIKVSSYDLVAVRGGEPDVMFDKGIEALGGIQAYVKKGQTVVIKPNIGWDAVPERAATTNPALISRIIKHCHDAGAKDVYVFDHTCDNWNKCYVNSGLQEAARNAGAKVVAGNTESYYHEVTNVDTKVLTSTKIHELILESDVFINVPVLKHHTSTKITISMKNLMGIVWDRRFWHSNDLHQCIAEFPLYRKPDLNVVDAYMVIKRNGPRGVSKADLVALKSLILSADIVAADAAGTKFFGEEPERINYIKIAHDMKIGNMNLDELNIKRITV